MVFPTNISWTSSGVNSCQVVWIVVLNSIRSHKNELIVQSDPSCLMAHLDEIDHFTHLQCKRHGKNFLILKCHLAANYNITQPNQNSQQKGSLLNLSTSYTFSFFPRHGKKATTTSIRVASPDPISKLNQLPTGRHRWEAVTTCKHASKWVFFCPSKAWRTTTWRHGSRIDPRLGSLWYFFLDREKVMATFWCILQVILCTYHPRWLMCLVTCPDKFYMYYYDIILNQHLYVGRASH